MAGVPGREAAKSRFMGQEYRGARTYCWRLSGFAGLVGLT